MSADLLLAGRFRDVIERRMGLQFEDSKLSFLDEVLERRCAATRLSAETYLAQLDRSSDLRELGAIAEEVTVPETYFFRNNEQFQALIEHVLPERWRAGGPMATLHLLSAACATGEEAYSLLMAAHVASPGRAVDVLGVDLSPMALQRARAGRYSSWSMRETPPDLRARWFKGTDRDVMIDESLRRAVRFEHMNLAADDPRVWQPEFYDVIFCRNALMYFSPRRAKRVIASIAASLVPGGYLFLGHAESLRGLSTDFELRSAHGTFYYQRRGGRPLRPPGDASNAGHFSKVVRLLEPPPLQPAPDVDWFNAIRHSAGRIQDLSEGVRSGTATATATATSTPTATASAVAARDPHDGASAADVSSAIALLRAGRFHEALADVDERVAERPPARIESLVRATLLLHLGRLDEAVEACEALLRDDDPAEAHELLALCLEESGDRAGAADEARAAIHRKPDFVMARLHLGLLAVHLGQSEEARRELRRAVERMDRVDELQLALFGGGFSRQALVALCRAQLKKLGASS